MAQDGSIIFNNKSSFEDLDLLFNELPSIPISIEEYESIPVESRSGNLTIKLGTYKEKRIPISFILNTEGNYYRKIDEIIEWLNIIDNNELIFSFDNERKYIVKAIEGSENIQRQLKWSDVFTITFICESFKYFIYEEPIVFTNKSITLFNSGSFESEPNFKIYANGDISIDVNGKVITIYDVDEYIEIHPYRCFKELTNKMPDTNGVFPIKFNRGINEIELIGSISKTEILINTRFI